MCQLDYFKRPQINTRLWERAPPATPWNGQDVCTHKGRSGWNVHFTSEYRECLQRRRSAVAREQQTTQLNLPPVSKVNHRRWAEASPLVDALLISYFTRFPPLSFCSHHLLNSCWAAGMRLGKRGTMGVNWMPLWLGCPRSTAISWVRVEKREGGVPQVLLGGRRWSPIPWRNRQRTEGNGSLLCAMYLCLCVCVCLGERAPRGGGLIDSLSDWGTVKRRPQSDRPW